MWNLSYIEAQDLCKHQIDSMEHWSRRIINEKFTEKYGEDFFNFRCEDGTPLIKKEICNKVEGRLKSTPLSYPRKVDALTIEDLEYFFCKECFYNGLFKGLFEPFFSGSEE